MRRRPTHDTHAAAGASVAHQPYVLYVRVVYVIDCASAAKWPPAAAVAVNSRYIAFVFFTFLHMHFSSTPTSILNLTVS